MSRKALIFMIIGLFALALGPIVLRYAQSDFWGGVCYGVGIVGLIVFFVLRKK